MMAFVYVLLLPIAWLLGKAALKILYRVGKRTDLFWEDELLTGGILLIGLAEAAHLGAVVLGWSVSVVAKVYLLMLAGTACAAGAVLLIAAVLRKKRPEEKSSEEIGPEKIDSNDSNERANFRIRITGTCGKTASYETAVVVILALLIGVQLIGILFTAKVYLQSDLTLEQVQSFLHRDALYQVNPMTGFPYQEGLPSRLKILCLPTFYAILCRISPADPELLIWHVIPVLVLAGAYLAYGSLSRIFFGESRIRRLLFLAAAALLFFVEDSFYGADGFGLLHGGFQGIAIRNAVLLPYLFGVCLRKKWKLAIAVIAAEACIVWTTYGLGMGVLLAAAVLFGELLFQKYADRKEDSVCGNS